MLPLPVTLKEDRSFVISEVLIPTSSDKRIPQLKNKVIMQKSRLTVFDDLSLDESAIEEPQTTEKEPEEKEPEYTGPTVEELKREVEEFRTQWEAEKAEMIAKANEEAAQIIQRAQDTAFEEIKHQSDEASVIKNGAKEEASSIVDAAKKQAEKIIAEARAQEQEIISKAESEGLKQGREEGFSNGRNEVERLVERMHKIIDSVQDKRQEILDNTEQQIVDLVILMTRKVVKIMSDNQKSVIMANVVQALKKVKGRGDVTLRVNLSDIKLTTEHVQDFIKEVENIKNISKNSIVIFFMIPVV